MFYLKSVCVLLAFCMIVGLIACEKESPCEADKLVGNYHGVLDCNTTDNTLDFEVILYKEDSVQVIYDDILMDAELIGCNILATYNQNGRDILLDLNYEDSLMQVEFKEVLNFERSCSGEAVRK